ncbi:putative membrane protein YeiB [Kibdelosporangium banguiense]|uniref:Membrane protein YeiB n=1 Tax=Kibdelosporangium banguiense TaxID=1365924 RepID=A0ABS4TS76_9PSEU|nr:DUF418 domain-containing protein [Kibdelosporangium banguiense]MBP2327247.1 putative membrane protein YeiB [Kibdelosporangium banguiense]
MADKKSGRAASRSPSTGGAGSSRVAGWFWSPDRRGEPVPLATLGCMALAEHTAGKQETSTARLAGIDLARGLAVFGMFAAHVGPDPAEGGLIGGLMQLAHGRASALFATLAGLSLAIMSGRQRPATGLKGRQAAVKIAIRAVILLAFGTALTMTGTSVSVILAYYGVYFLLALPFTRLRAMPLAVIAAVTAIVGPLLSFLVRGSLARTGWDQLIASNDPIEILSGEGVLQLLLTGAYPAATWMPFVFAGMALGRIDLQAAATRARLAVMGPVLALIGYGGSWIALHLFGGVDALTSGNSAKFGDMSGIAKGVLEKGAAAKGAVSTDSPAWLLVSSPHSGTPFEIIGALGVGITVLAAALVLAEKLPRLCRPVTAVGSMSLTAYVGHVIAIGLLGLDAQPGEPLPVLLGFIAGAIVFALVWSRFLRRGPLEFLLNKATTPARWLK